MPDDTPHIAQKAPYPVEVEAGKSTDWPRSMPSMKPTMIASA